MAAEAVLLTRAGLAKLLKQKGVWITIFAAVLFSCWIQWHSGTAQEGWRQSVQAAQSQLQEIRSGHGCQIVTGLPGQHCSAAQIAGVKQSARSNLAQAMQFLRSGAAGFTVLGSIVVSLGLLGTGVGFILGVAIGAIAVETEMRSGGLKATLLAAARRRLVLLTTAIACYLCAILGAVCNIAGVIGVSALQSSARPLGVSATTLSGAGSPSIWILFLATAVTPAVGIGVALAAGFLGQSSLAAIGGVTALVVIDRLVAVMATSIAPYTLIGTIGRLTDALGQSQLAAAGVTVRLWPAEIINGGAIWGFLEALAIAGCGLFIAAVSLQRREIR
jgi:hypothetical protein